MTHGENRRRTVAIATLAGFLLVGTSGCLGQLNDYMSRPSGSNDTSGGSVNGPLDVPYGQAVIGSDHVMLGAWLGDWPSPDNDLMDSFESTSGVRLDIVDIYMDWTVPYSDARYAIEEIARHGAVPQVTWLPNGLTTDDIVEGTGNLTLSNGRSVSVDAYLNAFANGACEAALDEQTPILIRTLHEPNGDWHAWALGWEADDGSLPNTPDSYKAAWDKIRSMFETYCDVGKHILMVWAINQGETQGLNVSFMTAYPGDANLEYIGIDGYNWGEHAPWGWQTFHNLFRQPYCAVQEKTSKPILVSEVASAEDGGSKAEWIRLALNDISGGKYPQVHGLVWVNQERQESAVGATVDWRVESSPASLNAYSEGGQTIQKTRQDSAAAGPSQSPVTC